MSAAATAAGYLYASGRLRMRNCGRFPYPDEATALTAGTRILRSRGGAFAAYHCGECKKWHLAKKTWR